MRWHVAGVAAALLVAPGETRADRYEATIAVRPVATLARVDDMGVDKPASVPGGGIAGGLSWGVRNWLDVGLELSATTLGEARHEDAMVRVSGNPTSGELRRTSRLAQLRAGATFRMGVGWVPTVFVGLGGGARIRSEARLRLATAGGAEVVPDDAEGGLAFDLAAVLRIGLEHRLTRRWSVGLAAGATQCIGIGAPNIQLLDATVILAYTWYPLW